MFLDKGMLETVIRRCTSKQVLLKKFSKFHRKAPVLGSHFNKEKLKRDSNTDVLLQILLNF